MATLEDILEVDFVCGFLLEENNTYEDLVLAIENRHPNLRGCSLRSVKRYCSNHGIKKRKPVSNEEIDTAMRSAISEVYFLPNVRNNF